MNTAHCKKCGALMIWTVSPVGNALPLDAVQHRLRPKREGERGVVAYAIDETPVETRARSIASGLVISDEPQLLDEVTTAYVSHFATCTAPFAFSKRGKR